MFYCPCRSWELWLCNSQQSLPLPILRHTGMLPCAPRQPGSYTATMECHHMSLGGQLEDLSETVVE